MGKILSDLGLGDPYEPVFYGDLAPETQLEIDKLNLVGILEEQVDRESDIDIPLVRFVLRRLGQLGDDSAVTLILENTTALHPVFPDVIRYFEELPALDAAQRQHIGGCLLELLDNSVISELEYHRMWALDLFARSADWDNEDRFVQLTVSERKAGARRKLILALGRSGHSHWFQARRQGALDEGPWVRRAFLAAASCLPPDARRHWYRAIDTRLDVLERAVVQWVRAAPFGA
jgi:hypothetical protein